MPNLKLGYFESFAKDVLNVLEASRRTIKQLLYRSILLS